MISPKLLTGPEGALYAYRGLNQIAWRFGHRIKVCKVEHVFGPFYKKLGEDFMESIDVFYAHGFSEAA